MFHSGSHNNSLVRVSSLIEQLESNVRKQALLLRKRSLRTLKVKPEMLEVHDQNASSTDQINVKKSYSIGSLLITFLLDRKLISLTNDLDQNHVLMKRKGSYFIPKNLYAVCCFDVSLLPIKFNLPMVCKPLDWGSVKKTCNKSSPQSLSDLAGGYLSTLTGDIYDRFRLLSSSNINNFDMEIGCQKSLCRVLNKLQGQPFQINSNLLTYIMENMDTLVSNGLLMPNMLTSIQINEVSI